jgi:hypothetical protein
VEGTPLERRGKLLVGASMIVILGLTLTFLQQQFDRGDYEKAIRMFATQAPGQRWSINEEMVARGGSAAVNCDEPRLISSFRGTLEVVCRTQQPLPYRFRVDLVRKRVDAEDAHTQELLDTVAARNELPRDGGAPGG